ncbi:hypothetical protein AAFF_G00211930 [Aldrovandia affinis]|uniref:Uncharacterized protein n=1 Tax=Aldrovandia affinis TaxID=143900 RepID=A0AAD7RGY1_9TELE|nr:hypothetical protein AAFF_G00211930 [Aldrovandia affinis]
MDLVIRSLVFFFLLIGVYDFSLSNTLQTIHFNLCPLLKGAELKAELRVEGALGVEASSSSYCLRNISSPLGTSLAEVPWREHLDCFGRLHFVPPVDGAEVPG